MLRSMVTFDKQSQNPSGKGKKGGNFSGNRGHVTVSQPRKPSERPVPQAPKSEKQ